MKIEKLSAVIITYNEEKNISRCINSLRDIVDEIIVLDSFSTDQTIEIASQQGAKVWQEPFRGYIEQKNRAIELASYNYILSVDADEEIDKELQQSILSAKKTFIFSAYKMKRCTNHCGRFIRYGTSYPDKKIRLFDKRVAIWGGLNPHDTVIFKKTIAVKQLKGEILHYSFPTLKEHFEKNNRYSSIVAKSYYQAGKRTSLFKVLANPLWAFIHGFLIRRGFLNGKQGFIIAWNQARYTHLKHKKLWKLQTEKRQPILSDVQTTTNTDRLAGNIRAEVRS